MSLTSLPVFSGEIIGGVAVCEAKGDPQVSMGPIVERGERSTHAFVQLSG